MLFLDVEMTETLEEALRDVKMEEETSPEDIDPRVTGVDSQTSLVEELESFAVDFADPTQTLQVRKNLIEESNKALKKFICHNFDVFAWKHEDMVEIDLTVSYHRLNVDPKFP
ncbi:Uncharacterized protein Adt_33418 [Abeliophyllum distichum]|uniref:Uncharacterized protein n=1 Tax=Abeliophyllum distichum TaxID=126358 RepID=A0ABD1QW59_9LAMI